MSGGIRIREVRRKDIDVDKLAFALLRLAREQLEREAKAREAEEAKDE